MFDNQIHTIEWQVASGEWQSGSNGKNNGEWEVRDGNIENGIGFNRQNMCLLPIRYFYIHCKQQD